MRNPRAVTAWILLIGIALVAAYNSGHMPAPWSNDLAGTEPADAVVEPHLREQFLSPIFAGDHTSTADATWPLMCGKQEEGLGPEAAIEEIEAALSECVSA